MSILAFTLQVLPVPALALVATAVGSAWQVNDAWRLPLLLIGVLLFVAMLTFRRVRVWNLVLLLTLAAVAGALLGSTFEGEHGGSWGGALALTFGMMGLAVWVGNALRRKLRPVGSALWMLAWLYLAGWFLVVVLDPEAWLRALWSGAGVILFGCLLTVWFSELWGEDRTGKGLAVPQGCDLYILGLNIAIAARVLLTSLITS
jgi:FtsH-binding integral membrane protein